MTTVMARSGHCKRTVILFAFFLARYIAVVSVVSICLGVILALWPSALQYQLSALRFVCVLLFVVVLSCVPKQNQGRRLVDRKLVKAPPPPPPPSNFIAGRPEAARLFWFFGGFRCGVPLFIVILVIFKYKSR